MDLTAVATCVQHPSAEDADRWFALVCSVAEVAEKDGETGWAEIRERLAAGAADAAFPSDVAETFIAYADVNGGTELLAFMAARRHELSAAYAEALAAPAAEDEGAWHAYLAAEGPRWDGTEAAWPGFRDWFVAEAATRGVGRSAAAFCEYVDAQPGADGKIEIFARYGVPVVPPTAAEDEHVWHGFLATEGGRFDGTDESWPAFRAWFEAEAAARGVPAAARGFCECVEASGDKREAFAAYGVRVVPTEADAAAVADQLVAAHAETVIADFRTAYPELANFSDDEVREAMRAVLAAGPASPAAS